MKVKVLLKYENPLVIEQICELEINEQQIQELKEKLRKTVKN